MIVCKDCGNHNSDGDDFCGSCGAFLEWTGERVREQAAEQQPAETPALAPAVADEQVDERRGIVQRVKDLVGIDAEEETGAVAVASEQPIAVGGGDGGDDEADAPSPPDDLAVTSTDPTVALQLELADKVHREAEEAESARRDAERRAREEAAAAELAREEARSAERARRRARDQAKREAAAVARLNAELEQLERARQEAEARARAESEEAERARAAAAEAEAALREDAERNASIAEEARTAADQQLEAERAAAERLRAELDAAVQARQEAEERAAAEAALVKQARAAAEAADAARRDAEELARSEAEAAEKARRAAALVARPTVVEQPTAQPDASLGTPPTGAATPVPDPGSVPPQWRPTPTPTAEPAPPETPTAPRRPAHRIRPREMAPARHRERPAPRTTAAPSRTLQPGDLICGQCGEGNAVSRNFCRRCGHSLAEADQVAEGSFLERLLRRPPRIHPAGSRPMRRGAGGAAAQAKGARRKIRRAMGRVFGALAAVTLVLGLVGVAVSPLRSTLADKGRQAIESLRRTVRPEFVPVRPTDVTAGALAEFPDSHLIDLNTATWWVEDREGPGQGAQIAIDFGRPVNVDQIGFHSGAGDEKLWAVHPRPWKLHLVFDNNATTDLELRDSVNEQWHPVSGGQEVSKVVISVLDVYPGQEGNSELAIAEVEFRVRR